MGGGEMHEGWIAGRRGRRAAGCRPEGGSDGGGQCGGEVRGGIRSPSVLECGQHPARHAVVVVCVGDRQSADLSQSNVMRHEESPTAVAHAAIGTAAARTRGGRQHGDGVEQRMAHALRHHCG
jgi:hypothetical protein